MRKCPEPRNGGVKGREMQGLGEVERAADPIPNGINRAASGPGSSSGKAAGSTAQMPLWEARDKTLRTILFSDTTQRDPFAKVSFEEALIRELAPRVHVRPRGRNRRRATPLSRQMSDGISQA
jgi:hypothetical protein